MIVDACFHNTNSALLKRLGDSYRVISMKSPTLPQDQNH